MIQGHIKLLANTKTNTYVIRNSEIQRHSIKKKKDKIKRNTKTY